MITQVRIIKDELLYNKVSVCFSLISLTIIVLCFRDIRKVTQKNGTQFLFLTQTQKHFWTLFHLKKVKRFFPKALKIIFEIVNR